VSSSMQQPTIAGQSALLGAVTNNGPFSHRGRNETETLEEGVVWTAHELRGPLVAARAALDHLVDIGSHGQSNPELLRETRDELDDVLRFVDPLLRCATGVPAPSSHVDLAELAHEVVEAEVRRCPSAGGRLRLSASSFLLVHGDPDLLKIAMSNLVRNALRYSDEADPVLLSVRRTDFTALVRIEDRGPGVLPGEHDGIFERGRRGRIWHPRPGQGLGLFIARHIVESHGGTVRVEQSAIGADFRIELPFVARGSEACAS
jgi:signal transduction histidine kinase